MTTSHLYNIDESVKDFLRTFFNLTQLDAGFTRGGAVMASINLEDAVPEIDLVQIRRTRPYLCSC